MYDIRTNKLNINVDCSVDRSYARRSSRGKRQVQFSDKIRNVHYSDSSIKKGVRLLVGVFCFRTGSIFRSFWIR